MAVFRLFVLFVAVVTGLTATYNHHKVLRIYPNSEFQVSSLRSLSVLPHTPQDFDFWLKPGIIGNPVDIRVSPTYYPTLVDFLQTEKLPFTISVDDVQSLFDIARIPSSQDGTWDNAYHMFGDIQNWLKEAATANPSFVKLVEIGLTYQNRTVYGLTISKAPAGSPQIYLDGGIHAREWIAPAVVQYIIGQMVNNSGPETHLGQVLSKIEWTLVPVWNADGYSYTWTNDPNWVKNRQPNSGSGCIGVDICRNFAAGWGMEGSSSNPCEEDYRGTSAWSAPEAVMLRDYVQKNLPRLRGYVNFHSYAQLWLNPYGYTGKDPADYNLQTATAKNITAAIQAVHGEVYQYGPAYSTIYPAAGIPSDWTYDALKVIFSHAVELRGNSFQPPPSLIVPNGEEILAVF